MAIYKTAQEIKFENEVGVKTKINRMKDAEFSAYVSVLSQVHEDVKNGIELGEAIDNAAGAAYAAQVSSLIKDIGLKVFSSISFDQISQKLEGLREAKKPALTPFVPPQAKIPGVPAKPEPEPESEFLDLDSILMMSSEDRIEYLSNLTYPDPVKAKASHMLENLKLIDSAYSDEDTPESSREWYREELASAIISLLDMASGEAEEDEEDIETEEVETGKDVQRKERVSSKSTIKPKEYVSNASTSSLMTEETVFNESEILNKNPSFKEFLAKSKNPYIDFSVSPPNFNDDMDGIFGNFVRKIEDVFRKSMLEGSSADLKRQFNDAVYAIKTADTMTFDVLREALKVAPPELETQYKDIEHRFVNECPSAMILKPEYFDTLFFAAVMLSAPKLGNMLLSEDMSDIVYEAKKNARIQEEDFDDIKNAIENFSKDQFKKKSESFFRLTSKHKIKNFLDRAGLRWDFVFKRGLEKVYPTGPEYYLRPCPTCYKWVPWNYTGQAKKRNEEFQGFKIRMVSFFTDDRERPKITLEELNSKKWPAPPSALYSREREKELVIKYAKEGEKSWEEIQDLLNSNDPQKHEEGWHRRTGALYAAGGTLLTPSDILIKYTLNECPFDESGKTGSLCGISFASTKSPASISKSMALQPQWNGVKDTAKNNFSGNVNTLVEDLWDDKEMFQEAKKLQRAGFKFSKINFACTCRISKMDSLSSYKHSNIAISKTGPAGSKDFVHPTLPNGSLDTSIEDGTLSYMVCGAPTSLSSFDRNPESMGFILKYMQAVRNQSFDDYKKLINYLIRDGVDVQDIIDLDQSLDKYLAEGIEKQSNSIQNRMKKLAELAKISFIELNKENSDERKYLSDLTLVCPFGHRFTVGHSLEFGEANAGIFQKENIVQDYSDIITTQGEANLRALIKFRYLVPANDPEMSGFPSKLPYEEWSKQPERTVFPDFKNPERPLLLFTIPVNINGDTADYVFYKGGRGWKNNIWPANHSYESSRYEKRTLEVDSSAKSALSAEFGGDDEEGGTINLADVSGFNDWKIDEYNPVSEYEFNRIPATKIPGTPDLEDETGISMEAFDKKIAAFSRSLKSTLRIITTWTKGLISQSMMSALLTEYKVEVSPYINEIVNPMLSHIIMEDIDGNILPKEETGPIIEEIKQYFVDTINRKVDNLYDWIRSNVSTLEENQDFDNQVAINIIYHAIKNFNSPNPDIGFNSEYGEAAFDLENFDNLAKAMAKKIIDSNPNLVLELTLKSQPYFENLKRKVRYNGRILLIGYAQYLATVLPTLYKKYCQDPESPFYIGYDIGIDLSSPSRILGFEKDGIWIGGITEQDVENIVSSLAMAVEKSGKFKKPKPQTLHYGHRLDRAWEELESYLNKSRKQAISARAMELSKDYIVSRMSVISGQEIGEIREKIANSFPNRSLLFNGTTEKPETGSRLVTKRRLPFISKNVPFLKLPGTQRVEEWIVRDKTSRENHAFSTKQEAENYLQKYLAENPSASPEQWVVEPDPYWVNTNNGYDGSKVQVGMITAKVIQDFNWPPAPGDMDFAGINLPFEVPSVGADASINKAKNLPIPNYRFVIDFEGAPLDISILFRKGRSDESFGEILKAEKFIINANKDFKRNIEIFKQEHAQEIANDSSILANFTAIEEAKLADIVEPYLRVIDATQLYFTSKSSYIDPANIDEPRKMLRLALEDPLRAYKIIMNPEVRGVSLTPEDQGRLINFIIKVYNLDLVRDLARQAGGPYEELTSIDLLEKAETMKFKFLGGKMKKETVELVNGEERLGWVHDAGQYYDLIPGEKDSDYGSYLQYVYNTPQNLKSTLQAGAHPNILVLIRASEAAAKALGLTEAEGNNNVFAEKMEKDMLTYIRSRTSGERKNEVKDRRGRKKKKASSEYIEKISLRQKDLERIVLSMGLPFEDVELPNF